LDPAVGGFTLHGMTVGRRHLIFSPLMNLSPFTFTIFFSTFTASSRHPVSANATNPSFSR
jgi:hypothetical protein